MQTQLGLLEEPQNLLGVLRMDSRSQSPSSSPLTAPNPPSYHRVYAFGDRVERVKSLEKG